MRRLDRTIVLTIAVGLTALFISAAPSFAVQQTDVAHWNACLGRHIAIFQQNARESDRNAKTIQRLEKAHDYRGLCRFGKETGAPSLRRGLERVKGMLADFCAYPTYIVDAAGSKNQSGNGNNIRQSIAELTTILKSNQEAVEADCARAAAEDSTSSKTSSGRKFKHYQNTDLVASLVGKISAGTVAECENACANTASCNAYSFNRWNAICFLKGVPTESLLEPSIISGVFGTAPRRSDAKIGMVRYRGKVFPGKPFTTGDVDSFEACESRCQTNGKCVAFSFVKVGSSCKLFDMANEYAGGEGIDSGVKRQPVP